ncbi:MAG: 2'-5' RNA ligase family protein [Chitinophagaceae bacterium]
MQHLFTKGRQSINTKHSWATINEYLLVLNLTPAMEEKVMQVKQAFANTYNHPPAAFSKPHITLVSFSQIALAEQNMVQQLQQHIQQHTPITITTEGFGSLPTHTLYCKVTSNNSIVALVKHLRGMQRLLTLNQFNKPHFITTPHITIAQKLQAWQYEQGWKAYKHQQFTARCITDKVVLLRRNALQKNYTSVQIFHLAGIAQKKAATQTQLF